MANIVFWQPWLHKAESYCPSYRQDQQVFAVVLLWSLGDHTSAVTKKRWTAASWCLGLLTSSELILLSSWLFWIWNLLHFWQSLFTCDCSHGICPIRWINAFNPVPQSTCYPSSEHLHSMLNLADLSSFWPEAPMSPQQQNLVLSILPFNPIPQPICHPKHWFFSPSHVSSVLPSFLSTLCSCLLFQAALWMFTLCSVLRLGLSSLSQCMVQP